MPKQAETPRSRLIGFGSAKPATPTGLGLGPVEDNLKLGVSD